MGFFLKPIHICKVLLLSWLVWFYSEGRLSWKVAWRWTEWQAEWVESGNINPSGEKSPNRSSPRALQSFWLSVVRNKMTALLQHGRWSSVKWRGTAMRSTSSLMCVLSFSFLSLCLFTSVLYPQRLSSSPSTSSLSLPPSFPYVHSHTKK